MTTLQRPTQTLKLGTSEYARLSWLSVGYRFCSSLFFLEVMKDAHSCPSTECPHMKISISRDALIYSQPHQRSINSV